MTTTSVAVQHRDHTALSEEFARALVAHLNRLRAESHPHDPPTDPANVWGQMQHLPLQRKHQPLQAPPSVPPPSPGPSVVPPSLRRESIEASTG